MKIIILGDAGVGKTTLMYTYVNGRRYHADYAPYPYQRMQKQIQLGEHQVTLGINDIGNRCTKKFTFFRKGKIKLSWI